MSGARCAWAVAALILSGCGGTTTLLIRLSARGGIEASSMALRINPPGGNHKYVALPVEAGHVALPGTVVARLPDVAGSVTVTASGADSTGRPFAVVGTVTSVVGKRVTLDLVLTGLSLSGGLATVTAGGSGALVDVELGAHAPACVGTLCLSGSLRP